MGRFFSTPRPPVCDNAVCTPSEFRKSEISVWRKHQAVCRICSTTQEYPTGVEHTLDTLKLIIHRQVVAELAAPTELLRRGSYGCYTMLLYQISASYSDDDLIELRASLLANLKRDSLVLMSVLRSIFSSRKILELKSAHPLRVQDARLVDFYREFLRSFKIHPIIGDMWVKYDERLEAWMLEQNTDEWQQRTASSKSITRNLCPADLLLWEIVYRVGGASSSWNVHSAPECYYPKEARMLRCGIASYPIVCRMVRAFATTVFLKQVELLTDNCYLLRLPKDLLILHIGRFLDRAYFKEDSNCKLECKTGYWMGGVMEPPMQWNSRFADIKFRTIRTDSSVYFELALE